MSTFSIEVIDHYLQDDASYYQNHIFILQIFIEQNEIRLYRSYAAFCELDTKLRRQYPRSSIPTLSLAGLPSFQKKNHKRFSLLSSNHGHATVNTGNMAPNATALDVRESIITTNDKAHSQKAAIQSHRHLTKRIDAQEVIPNRKIYLTRYLNDLLKIPEVVMSDTFQIFLDEESPMDNQPSHIPDYNEENFQGLEINLLLHEEMPTVKTISKEFLLPLSVYQGGVVVWSFETKQHDIGFSIAFDNKEIVAYQRVQSHTKPVQGYFEVPKTGQMLFTWDNTYSKWRNKQMSYIVRIVDKEVFQEIIDQATSMVGEKLQKHKQRVLLKKVLSQIAHDTMFAAGSNDDIQQRMLLHQQQQQQQQQSHTHSTDYDDTPIDAVSHDPYPDQLAPDARLSLDQRASLTHVLAPDGGESTTDVSAFYPPPSHPPPLPSTSQSDSSTSTSATATATATVSAVSTQHPRVRSSLYSNSNAAGNNNSNNNSASTGGNVALERPSTLLPSAADHAITIKLLTQQLETIKSEKAFLQQALAQAETALVQERSACASNFQQVEDMTMSKEMMEEELTSLQEENETLRKELHDVYAAQHDKPFAISSAPSRMLHKLNQSLQNPHHSTDIDNNNNDNNNNNGDNDMTLLSEEEEATMRLYMNMNIEEFLLHYPSSSANANDMAEHIRQLLSLHHFPGLVHFARQLLSEKQHLLGQIQSLEQQYTKQKTLAKQLKTAALQLKEQQAQTQTLLQHAEHEKVFVISENETVSAKNRSYENQLRLLRKENQDLLEAYRLLYHYLYPTVTGTGTVSSPNHSYNNHNTHNNETASQNTQTTQSLESSTTSTTTTTTSTANAVAGDEEAPTDRLSQPQSPQPLASADDTRVPTPTMSSVAERMKQLAQKNLSLKKKRNDPTSAGTHLPTDAVRDTTASSSATPTMKHETASSSAFPHPSTFHHSAAATAAVVVVNPNSTLSQTHVFLSPEQLQAQVSQRADDTAAAGGGDDVSPPSLETQPLGGSAATHSEEGDFFSEDTTSVSPSKVVVHDFAKAEPDEISLYLTQMTSSFMNMLGVDDGDTLDDTEVYLLQGGGVSDAATPTTPAEELKTFRRYSGSGVSTDIHSVSPVSQTSSGVAGGTTTATSGKTASSFLSSLKQMSFGF